MKEVKFFTWSAKFFGREIPTKEQAYVREAFLFLYLENVLRNIVKEALQRESIKPAYPGGFLDLPTSIWG